MIQPKWLDRKNEWLPSIQNLWSLSWSFSLSKQKIQNVRIEIVNQSDEVRIFFKGTSFGDYKATKKKQKASSFIHVSNLSHSLQQQYSFSTSSVVRYFADILSKSKNTLECSVRRCIQSKTSVKLLQNYSFL